MLEIFAFSFNAVAPLIIMMTLGYFLKRVGFADDFFFKKANALVFKVFLPVLLFINVYEIEELSSVNWMAVFYACSVIILLWLIGNILTRVLFKKRETYGPLVQCCFRSNYAIIGIPLAETLGGAPGVGFASVLSAVAIPIYNVLAVVTLSHYSSEKKQGQIKETLKKTVKNPLIIGVLTGVLMLFIRSFIPRSETGELLFSLKGSLPSLYSSLVTISKGASPLALVVLGARFDFSKVRALLKEIVFGTAMRLCFAPLFGIGLGFILSKFGLIGLTNVEYPALISLYSTPIAVSSAVMVGEIGGDEQLAGQLVVWTSVFSMFTMFAVIFIMKTFSLI